jgi:hypothetical protein
MPLIHLLVIVGNEHSKMSASIPPLVCPMNADAKKVEFEASDTHR